MNPRPVAPKPITGKEATGELILDKFPAFAGRNLREAYRLMLKSIREDFTVFATLSGAMTPAGLHHSCLIPLIEMGAVNSLTTTGANLYHDAHRTIGHQISEIDPHGSDLRYRQEETIRIYDLGFSFETLIKTDDFFGKLMLSPPFQKAMTTTEFHYELGRAMARYEEEHRISPPSLLAACFKHEVPIFCGAPQDGSIFLETLPLWKRNRNFKFSLDIRRDVYQMAALQYLAQKEGQTAVWIFGGGVPKNYTLQGEPVLSQMFELDARGFDLDLQICVDVADNGALSSCTAGEGHTWGKTSADCVEKNSVYLRTDATLALPFLVHALRNEIPAPRPPKRLYRRIQEAEELLDREVERKLKG
ncbi:MAG: deoxyhypusine synthase family protein [Planctomycetes bacterium]|nr:deoxyhypusine synthase family protein [Planctomycetota bacterium]